MPLVSLDLGWLTNEAQVPGSRRRSGVCGKRVDKKRREGGREED